MMLTFVSAPKRNRTSAGPLPKGCATIITIGAWRKAKDSNLKRRVGVNGRLHDLHQPVGLDGTTFHIAD